ncbi:MAG: hypothetical protein JO262_07465 [Solirubrobacterales bacterium]|nr:hypothetical protein [Solirubrobacterales bacterium]MBV9941946.1 hypothetical protein [Solirubrobacterales bacterium]
MSRKRVVTRRTAASATAALLLVGCGTVRVQPTTPAGSPSLASRGKVDSPLTDMRNHLRCLRDAHLPVQVTSPTTLQVGPARSGATILFRATPGAAQADQINGDAQGAEVIGTAVVYPHQASDAELNPIEDCLAQGVQG